MKKTFLKILSIAVIVFQSGIVKAQQILDIKESDLIKIKELIQKKILIKDENNEIKLNEILKESDLIETIESMNATNCVGTITD